MTFFQCSVRVPVNKRLVNRKSDLRLSAQPHSIWKSYARIRLTRGYPNSEDFSNKANFCWVTTTCDSNSRDLITTEHHLMGMARNRGASRKYTKSVADRRTTALHMKICADTLPSGDLRVPVSLDMQLGVEDMMYPRSMNANSCCRLRQSHRR